MQYADNKGGGVRAVLTGIRGVICGVNALLLVVAFVLVSAFFSKEDHSGGGGGGKAPQEGEALFPAASYILAPSHGSGCLAWLNGACVAVRRLEEKNGESRPQDDWHALTGTLTLEEHTATGLFSEMNPLVVCLVVQAISTALSLGTQNGATTQTRWLLQKFGLGVLLFFAGLLLFMQHKWRIPANNLLWLEATLVVAFALLAMKHTFSLNQDGASLALAEAEEEAWRAGRGLGACIMADNYDSILAPAVTTPMLGVAVLSMAGQNDASVLLFTYATTCGVSLLWFVERHLLARARAQLQWRQTQPRQHEAGGGLSLDLGHMSLVLRLNMWLCVTPFVIRAVAQLHDMLQLPSAVRPQWVVAALVVTVVWFLYDVCLYTFRREHEDNGYEKEEAHTHPHVGDVGFWVGNALAALHYALYWTVLLVLLIGIYVRTPA
jgi:hypothetical protein